VVHGAARLAGGLVAVAAGELVLVALEPTSGWVLPLVALVVAGLGTGVVNATLGREAVASVPPEHAATGSGINNTSRYLGAAIGVTLVTVLCSPTGQEDVAHLVAGWGAAAVTCTVLTLLGAVVVLAGGRRSSSAAASGSSAGAG
jgi:dipeptide/tripeptide permease